MKGKFKIHGTRSSTLWLSSFLQKRFGAASIILNRIAGLGAHDSFSKIWRSKSRKRGVPITNCASRIRSTNAREVKVGSRELSIRRLSRSDSSGTSTRVPGAVLRWRQRRASAGDWRLATLASGSYEVFRCRGFAGEGDGEERWRWRGEKRSEAVLRGTRELESRAREKKNCTPKHNPKYG